MPVDVVTICVGIGVVTSVQMCSAGGGDSWNVDWHVVVRFESLRRGRVKWRCYR